MIRSSLFQINVRVERRASACWKSPGSSSIKRRSHAVSARGYTDGCYPAYRHAKRLGIPPCPDDDLGVWTKVGRGTLARLGADHRSIDIGADGPLVIDADVFIPTARYGDEVSAPKALLAKPCSS